MRRLAVLLAAGVFAAAACGGGSDDSASTPTTDSPVDSQPTFTEEEGSSDTQPADFEPTTDSMATDSSDTDTSGAGSADADTDTDTSDASSDDAASTDTEPSDTAQPDSQSDDAESNDTSDPDSGSATTAPPTTQASDNTASTTTGPPSTDASSDSDPGITAADLAGPGPYAVGVVTRALPEGNPVEIWYPADASAAGGTVSYNVRDFLPEAIAALVPSSIDDARAIDATRDASGASDGPFPVVLFSHGSTSFRLQSSVLAQHLATWGIVTASTDHPSRDLLNLIGGGPGEPTASIDDFRSLRTFLTTLDDDAQVGGLLDNERIALGGHSAGGGTIVQMADDDGILGYVSYASGLGDAAPEVASLFMLGELDMIVSPQRTTSAYESAPSPSWLWSFADAGHLAFSDLCAVGADGATLIDLAEAAGLDAFIDDRLRSLGTDGCEEPNRPVEEVWPGVHQAATGFYRWVFGIDESPIGLDDSVVTDGVTISNK